MKADYSLPDVYRHYRKTVGLKAKSKSVFNKFIRALNTEITEQFLSKPQDVQLPQNCGTIGIRKSKMRFDCRRSLRVDWKKTKELGKVIYHLNDHRNNYRYNINWNKGQTTNIRIYSFVPPRSTSRRLAQILLTNPSMDYFERIISPKYKPNDDSAQSSENNISK